MKHYIIYYNNGRPPINITADKVIKENNGWCLIGFMTPGATYLSGEYIDRIEVVND